MINLNSDIDWQYNYVISNYNKYLFYQDLNQSSPTYGCYDLNYWRDKIIDFADIRKQEIAASFLLLLSKNLNNKEINSYDRKKIIRSFDASVIFLERSQYSNGSFDEWYKGERGYAATEFPLIVYSLALFYCNDLISNTTKTKLINVLNKCANYLINNRDVVKANHEAAAAAGLAILGKVLNNKKFLTAANYKMVETMSRQDNSGWFPEVGGMDLGYCNVLLDYVEIFMNFSEINDFRNNINKLINFINGYITPEFTLIDDFSLCRNSYLSRYGYISASKYNNKAEDIKKIFLNNIIGYKGVQPILGDDLRFMRWAYLPIISKIELNKYNINSKYPLNIKKENIIVSSGVCSYNFDSFCIYISMNSGGNIKIYKSENLIAIIKPPIIQSLLRKDSINGYIENYEFSYSESSIKYKTIICKNKFYFPTFLQRVILRIFCTSTLGSKFIRKIIDHKRLQSKSALNQSTGGYSKLYKIADFSFKLDLSDSSIVYSAEVLNINSSYINVLFPLEINNEDVSSLSNIINFSSKVVYEIC